MRQNKINNLSKTSIYHFVKIWYKGGVETFINDLNDERYHKEVIVGHDLTSFIYLLFNGKRCKSDLFCFHTPLFFFSFIYIILLNLKAKVIIHNDLNLLYSPIKKLLAYPWIFFLLKCGVEFIYFNPSNSFLSSWSDNAKRGKYLNSALPNKKISLNDAPKDILFVGRYHPSKGFEKALSIIRRVKGKFTFKVYGDFPSHIIHQFSNDKINFFGFQKSLEYIYSTNSILLICSDYESGPLVAFEALSYGVPVLTTQVGVFQEEPVSKFFKPISIYDTEKEAVKLLEDFIKIKTFSSNQNLDFLENILVSTEEFFDNFFIRDN